MQCDVSSESAGRPAEKPSGDFYDSGLAEVSSFLFGKVSPKCRFLSFRSEEVF